ncbi:MAG: hypothetical protein UEY91_10405 [Lachnospiraceae bacterium]|nr:hypothetical protein [Lachnospiraceae bacterium]
MMAGTFLLPQEQGAEQQDGQCAGCREETVVEQGVSYCETFLFEIKNVFAKFDNRLG